MKARFNATGYAFRERLVPSLNLAQLFLEGPNVNLTWTKQSSFNEIRRRTSDFGVDR